MRKTLWVWEAAFSQSFDGLVQNYAVFFLTKIWRRNVLRKTPKCSLILIDCTASDGTPSTRTPYSSEELLKITSEQLSASTVEPQAQATDVAGQPQGFRYPRPSPWSFSLKGFSYIPSYVIYWMTKVKALDDHSQVYLTFNPLKLQMQHPLQPSLALRLILRRRWLRSLKQMEIINPRIFVENLGVLFFFFLCDSY